MKNIFLSNFITISLFIISCSHAKPISQMSEQELVNMSKQNIKNYCKTYANDKLEHEKMMWKVFCSKQAQNNMKILLISNISSISKEDVSAIAGFPFVIFENTSINEDFAKSLATFKGQGILFSRLNSIDAETAGALVKFQGKSIIFTALKELNPMLAKELAQFRGSELDLAGLETLDVNTAKEFLNFQGRALQFGGLKNVSPEVTSIFKGVKFYVSGI